MRSVTFLLIFAACLVAWECAAKNVDEHLAQMAEMAEGAGQTSETQAVQADNAGGNEGDSTPQTTTTTAKVAEAERDDQAADPKPSTDSAAVDAATSPKVISTMAPTKKPTAPATALQQVSKAQENMKKDSSISTSSLFALAALAIFFMATFGQVS